MALLLYGLYNGAMIPALTEIMPAEVRVAGFSLAYSLATAVFGGFTPVMSTALIEYTGDKASPGYWMSFAAVCACWPRYTSTAAARYRCKTPSSHRGLYETHLSLYRQRAGADAPER